MHGTSIKHWFSVSSVSELPGLLAAFSGPQVPGQCLVWTKIQCYYGSLLHKYLLVVTSAKNKCL